MKIKYALLTVLIVFAACNRQPGENNKYVAPSPMSLVVDHPAAVVFNPDIQTNNSGPDNQKVFVEKILKAFNIPVIASQAGSIEFVKNNGDRVRLDVKRLASNYDLILFNAVNDPVPCYFKDLNKAASDYFAANGSTKLSARQKTAVASGSTVNPEVNQASPLPASFPGYKGKRKTILLLMADTASLPLAVRNAPGIKWVEQRIDTRTLLNITFENDLITYANTDRYFTNGITFSLQAAWLGKLHFPALMIPYRNQANISYSLLLVQNIYTPTDTRVVPTLHNDRPYASYLYLGYCKVTSDPFRKIRLTNELDLGYTGPYSAGSYLQTLVHKSLPTNDKPLGWETQIKTEVILNYNLKAEKAIVVHDAFMLAASASAKLGTLYSQAGAGFRLQAGRQESYFGQTGAAKYPKWQYYFFMKTEGNYVGYDATLEGSVMNHNDIFKLTNNEITHWVTSGEAGFQLRYKNSGLEIAQHYLSPEYNGGLWHKWGRISLIFKL